jgi:hypothetical protein
MKSDYCEGEKYYVKKMNFVGESVLGFEPKALLSKYLLSKYLSRVSSRRKNKFLIVIFVCLFSIVLGFEFWASCFLGRCSTT